MKQLLRQVSNDKYLVCRASQELLDQVWRFLPCNCRDMTPSLVWFGEVHNKFRSQRRGGRGTKPSVQTLKNNQSPANFALTCQVASEHVPCLNLPHFFLASTMDLRGPDHRTNWFLAGNLAKIHHCLVICLTV